MVHLRVCGEESLHSARQNLKFIGLPSGHPSRRVARCIDVLPVEQTKIELVLGLDFCVDGHRLPWRFALLLVLVGLGLGPVLLRRLPVGDRLTRPPASKRPARHPPLFPLLATDRGLLVYLPICVEWHDALEKTRPWEAESVDEARYPAD